MNTCGVLERLSNGGLLSLHLWNLRKHTHMAVAGSLSSLSSCLFKENVICPPWFLTIIHHVSLTEFVFAVQRLLDANGSQGFKYAVILSIALPYPISHTLLYAYALYVASLSSSFVFHAYFLSFHVLFQWMDDAGMMASLCLFFLMKSAYEFADIALFIEELEI